MTQDKTSSEMMILQEEPSAATVPHAPAHKAAPRAPLRRAPTSRWFRDAGKRSDARAPAFFARMAKRGGA